MPKERESDEGFEDMERYVLYVRPLALVRGMKNAYHLWQQLGGSKASASDLWHGRTTGVYNEQLSRLCHILRCKPGKLFYTAEEVTAMEEEYESEKAGGQAGVSKKRRA